MGECLIVRRGGQAYKLPVLNPAYPQDVTIVASANGSATFGVAISEPGNPAEYTYKWYMGGSVIAGATGASVTISGLTAAQTTTVYCEVTNKAGTVTSRVAALTVRDWKPAYTYTGNHQLLDDGNYNWRIRFLTSGTLTFTSLGNGASGIDVFCVGGGGGGCGGRRDGGAGGGGGGGGYTRTTTGVAAQMNTGYAVVIGGGGSPGYDSTLAAGNGGNTSAFGVVAGGGGAAAVQPYASGHGGNGGSGGGAGGQRFNEMNGGSGGSDGGNGGRDSKNEGVAGTGQGSTTREFGYAGGTLYAGGGGGAGSLTNAPGGAGGGGAGAREINTAYSSNGATNTGGGGGGNFFTNTGTGYGGSGIVVIRNHQ